MRFVSERDRLATRWPLHHDTENDWRHGRLRRRAVHTSWAQWLERVPWELFVTFTFDPQKVFPVGQDRASREAVHWCNDSSRIYRRPLGWVFAPERGTSGQWHGHALMIGVPMVSGTLSCLPEAVAMWQARNGSIRVDPVDRVSGVTLYTTKTAAATGTIVLSDTMRRYRHVLAADILVSLFPVESETTARSSSPSSFVDQVCRERNLLENHQCKRRRVTRRQLALATECTLTNSPAGRRQPDALRQMMGQKESTC